MQPTTEHLEYLRDYLRGNLEYRETYEEYYDHILTALQARPEDASFYTSLTDIIENDLGGFEGMARAEARYQKATLGEMKRRYYNYLKEYLKFPLVGIIVICTIIIYCLVKQPWFNFTYFWVAYFAVNLIPPLLNFIRYFKTGYVFGDTKKSVKDDCFIAMKYSPGILFFLVITSHVFGNLYKSPADWFRSVEPITITIFFIVCTLHTLSFYKVYRDEFKISIVH